MLLDQIFTKIIWISSTTLLPSTKWTVFAYENDRSLLQTFLLRTQTLTKLLMNIPTKGPLKKGKFGE